MKARRWVAVLAVAALAASGGDDGGTTIGEGEDAVTVGGDTPESFPDDIPLPDEAEFIIEDTEGESWQFDVRLDPAEVAGFYSDKLDDWAVESSGDEATDEALAEMGFGATFDGGRMDVAAIEPAGTSRMIVQTEGGSTAESASSESATSESTPTESPPDEGSRPVGADLPVLNDPYAEVRTIVEGAGFEVCDNYEGSGDISGSYDSQSWQLGNETGPCSGEPLDWPGSLSIDLYNDESTASAELISPTTDAYLTWLVDPTTLVSTGEASTPAVLDALRQAFADYPAGGPGL